jgi:aryl-alcohol dehydrogenase-like predicted oxidoreductase
MNPIGASGLEVFPLALHCNMFGWKTDEHVAHEVLDAFVAGGGNFIDTADSYPAWVPGHSGGESEKIIGTWLATRKNRDRVVLSTKVGRHPQHRGLSAANVRGALEESLIRLQTDHIDVYYAHADDPDTAIDETAAAFDALLQAGKIRTIGLSGYRADRVREWMRISRSRGYALPVVLQPRYNLVRQDAGEPDIASVAITEKLAVAPYFSVTSGFLSNRYRTSDDLDAVPRPESAGAYFSHAGLWAFDALETIAQSRGVKPATVALAWMRTRPGVIAPVVSVRSVGELPALLASAGLDLDAAERKGLDEISATVLPDDQAADGTA